MRRVELPMGKVAARYATGESTYALGRAYGVNHVTIWRHLRRTGIKMHPRGWQPGNKCSPGPPIGNTNGRKRGGPYRQSGGYVLTFDRAGHNSTIHRACWEAYRGPIPKGHVIHHIDGNRTNNAIENLVCMTNGEHIGLHNARRGE